MDWRPFVPDEALEATTLYNEPSNEAKEAAKRHKERKKGVAAECTVQTQAHGVSWKVVMRVQMSKLYRAHMCYNYTIGSTTCLRCGLLTSMLY